MHYEFSDARELFEAVRGAAKDRDRLERQALAMRTREGVRAASLAPRVSATSDDYDGTAPTIERMAFEQASAERMLHDESLLEYGSALLYGRDGRGGLSDLMGTAVADVMFWRFCAALSVRVLRPPVHAPCRPGAGRVRLLRGVASRRWQGRCRGIAIICHAMSCDVMQCHALSQVWRVISRVRKSNEM